VRRYAQPIQLQRQRVGLLNLCQIAFNELAVEQDDFPHQLQIHKPGDDRDWLDVDRDRMRLVFRHLLENAIHAADGSARIEVDCQRVDSPPNAHLVVRIRDHGCGFSQQALNHAFEPFFTTKQRGTGLGLAICRRILAAHDAKIAIRCPADGERQSGEGTSVEVCLPLPPPTANGSFTH
jgi:signal transduction histidine kinase